MEVAACTNCQLCVEACPAVSASRDGRLSGAYRLDFFKRILMRRAGPLWRLLGTREPPLDRLRRFSETVFRCTLCANCQEVCPVGLRLRDLWASLRQDMVHSGAYPEQVDAVRENLLQSRNVFGEDNEERADWVEDLREPPEDGFVKDRAEVVYFAGCVAAYYPLAQQVPMAVAMIFKSFGVDFTLLGPEEWCCGFPLLGAGLKELAGDFIEHNTAAVRAKGARKVVFACPSCYQTWRDLYPPEFELAHFTEFMDELMGSRSVPWTPLDLTVTYHDPCDPGRGSRIFEAPRRIIRSIPGVRLIELPRNREECTCCGGGGNLEMTDPELSARITEQKIEEALGTGARAVVTSCQQCVRTMTTYARRNEAPIEVMDVTQLIQRSLKL